MNGGMPGEHPFERRDAFVAALLLAVTAASFARVAQCAFVGYDDPVYVTANPVVQKGVTAEGLRWAMTTGEAGNWHPLTWVSHMIDCQFFGNRPWAHHLMNVAFHAASVLLLYGLLRRTTGTLWESAVAAAVFADHPLRVESVAWVAERKDVLSTMLFMLTLWAYVGYARRPRPGRYALLVVTYAMGLMAKPMLVTLPFVLLLLDYWPLRRTGWARLVLEKLPLLAMAAASSAVTFLVQRAGSAVVEGLPLSWRLGNALVGYAKYLGKTFWPVDLAVLYPLFPEARPAWQVFGAAVLLLILTAVAVWQRKRRPYLLVGWLWFLGTLVPVIGIVQAGIQEIADRYTYVPSIGLAVALVWSAGEIVRRTRLDGRIVAAGAVALVGMLAICTVVQIGYWRDTMTLFRRDWEVTGDDNYVAHRYLATEYTRRGDPDAAFPHYIESLRVNPKDPEAQYVVGNTLGRHGEIDASIPHFLEAVRLNPSHAQAYSGLGTSYMSKGDFDRAAAYYQQALRINPNLERARRGLAAARQAQGRPGE